MQCSFQTSCTTYTHKHIYINGYPSYAAFYNCYNVTKETFPIFFKTCYYGGYISIDVKNTELNLLNREVFLTNSICNQKVYELMLSNSHIQSLGENVFNISNTSWNEMQKLNLSHNELVSVRAQDFKLSKLQTLDFSFNNLSSLGNLSYNLPSLKEFYLNNNNISAIQHDIFEKLTNLQILNLAYNKINSLDSHSFTNLQKLEKLYLSNNLLRYLRERPFQYLNNLNEIHLENNNLTFPDEKICLGLNKLKRMYFFNNTILKLNQNTLVGLKSIETFEIFSSLSSKLSGFEYNSIGMNTDTITELESHTFEGLDSLKKLKFSDFSLGTINTGCFNDLKALQYLYLENVTIRRIESESFVNVTALKTVSACSLIDISYDFCNLSLQYIGPNVFPQLTSYAQHYNNQYSAIRLDNNNLTVLLNNTFSGISSITLIRLDNNNISEIESNAFGNLIFNKNPYRLTPDSKRTQYNSLYLNKNQLEKIHKETFSKIRNIVELRLDRNKISEIHPSSFNGLAFHPKEGTQRKNILHLNENRLKFISKGIFSNVTHLLVLKLDNNEIENIESKSFINLQTLVHLDVSYNSLVDIDAYTFMGLENLEILNLTNNKLLNLNHDSFFGLNNLQHLLLTENKIQNIPVGTFQNSPSLRSLQLGNNHISDFKVGSFSNLNKLQFLNLSHNKFFSINEVVLFPLQSLTLLDLDDNFLSNMNYSSLTLHLPTVRYISVNNNNWTCSFLTQMLKKFRDRGINYVFNSTAMYKRENVYGIECQEEAGQYDEPRKSNSFIPFQMEDGNKDLLKNLSDILNHIKKETNLVSTSNSDILRQLTVSKQIFEDIKSNTYDMAETLHSNSSKFVQLTLVLTFYLL